VSLFDAPVTRLGGGPADLHDYAGHAVLIVNTASKCGLTPQYAGLQRLQERFGAQGFTVLGFPCNQFGGQEPGSADEIASFCQSSYQVGFPMFDKIEVNGAGQHSLYVALTAVPDRDGVAGDVQWNFEKFLVSPGGDTVQRFRPGVEPESSDLVAAIEGVLPADD